MINYWGYLAMVAIVVVTPGADTLVVVRGAMSAGAAGALRTALGVCLGLACWSAASAAGLAALVAASPTGYAAVKIAGATYLIYLGVRGILAARARSANEIVISAAGHRREVIQGFLTTLGNPKVGVFYLSLLPQFLPEGAATVGASMRLASIHIGLSFLCLAGYAALVLLLGNIFNRGGWQRAVDGIAGSVLCALGAGLIVTALTGGA
ncbi:LysE family translocator [Actinokineospora sp.]|uniref:LysE family translocator n=1 Tax=Actinokineospora sp. TaxID=1872133 RepID=UPI0040377305